MEYLIDGDIDTCVFFPRGCYPPVFYQGFDVTRGVAPTDDMIIRIVVGNLTVTDFDSLQVIYTSYKEPSGRILMKSCEVMPESSSVRFVKFLRCECKGTSCKFYVYHDNNINLTHWELCEISIMWRLSWSTYNIIILWIPFRETV